MPKRGSSSRGRGGKAAGSAAKRKRDASDAENVAGIQKRRTSAESSRAEGREWEKQFYQGVGVQDLAGLGCGRCRLVSPKIPFQAPFACDGSIEVMSGTKRPGSGSVRLCGPKDYWDDDMGAIFMVPLQHIEQIFVLPGGSTPGEEAHEVIIVPTGATGASSVKREYPQIISFRWPDKPVDDALRSKNATASYEENDTYLSVLKRVLDNELESFDKKVIDLTAESDEAIMMGKRSVLSPPTDSHMKSNANGHLHFLDQGILFTSDTQRTYMSFPSLDSVMVIRAKGGKDEIVGLNVVCRAKEPFYDGKEDGSGGATLINFGQMDHSLLDGIKGYLKKHDVRVMLCEQAFYDYENNIPATGWMPLMG